MLPDLPVILVADDPLVRGGLAALLPEEVPVVRAVAGDFDVALAVASTGAEAVLWDAEHELPAARRMALGVPVVVLTHDAKLAADALGNGAAGVLHRDVEADRLTASLLAARAGLRVVDERFAADLLRVSPRPGEGPLEPLTPREEEVLELLAEGRSNREIGLALDISPHTAKFHVDRILLKLDASGRTDAVVRAVRLGLLRL